MKTTIAILLGLGMGLIVLVRATSLKTVRTSKDKSTESSEETVKSDDAKSKNNLSFTRTSGKVDPYLHHIENDKPDFKYPFLLKVRYSDKSEFEMLAEELKKDGSLEISSNIGDIYSCRATREGILALDKCEAVIAIEGSRPWGGCR